MKIDEAIKMLKARLECVANLSGDKCSYSSCVDCHLCREQGGFEEQNEYLDIAIKALELMAKMEKDYKNLKNKMPKVNLTESYRYNFLADYLEVSE